MFHSSLILPDEWQNKLAKAFDSTIKENRVTINPVQGKGYVELHSVETGFDLALTDIVRYKDFSYYREKSDYNGLMIKYLVETPAVCSFINTDEEKHIIREDGIYFSTSDYPETVHTKAGYRYKTLSILLSFDWISKYHKDYSFILNAATIGHSIFAFEKVNTHIQQLVSNIFDTCETEPSYKELRVKAYGIELLTRITALFDYRKNIPYKESIRNKHDMDVLFKISRRLIADFEEECATIQSLSAEFGLSETKLKNNFKSFFGKPIHQYYQQERMNYAKLLLENGANVSETGYKIGYVNLSKFTLAYKKVFGISPKESKKLLIN
jgi:AraC-like DNA-binding protein